MLPPHAVIRSFAPLAKPGLRQGLDGGDVLVQLVAMFLGALLAEAAGLRIAAVIAPFGALLAASILWASPARRLLALPASPERDG